VIFRKLGWQLTASFFVVILFSMAVLGFYLLHRLDQLFTDDVDSSIHDEAHLVAQMWGQFNENGAPINQQQKRVVYTLCNMLTWQYGSRIRILDLKRNTVVDPLADPNPVVRNRTEVQLALEGQEATATWEPEQEDDPPTKAVAFPVIVSRPTRSGPKSMVVGVVYVSRSLKYQRQLLHSLRFDFVGGTLLSLLFSGIIAVMFSQFLSNPLRRMSAAAKQMAHGDMSAVVPVQGHNEIGELAQSFNYMAKELGHRTEQLVEEKNKLSAVLTHMQGGALLVDVEGHLLMHNRTALQMLGVDPASDPSQWDSFTRILDLAMTHAGSGSSSSQEVRLPGGVVAQVRWTPLRTESDEPYGFVILLNDITELRRVDEMKTEFVSNVSHELRTPLAAIKGLAEILLDGALHEAEGRRFLGSINHEVDRLTRLVKDLLDLSKIESGMVKFETRPVDLGDILLGVLHRMQARLEAATIVTDPDLLGCMVMADVDRLEQVLINLLGNAARYTPPGGLIKLSARGADGICEFCVENEGVGIPREELAKIFERFYRIDKHRSRDQGGTGLGLSITRHIVERMGGRISAESEDGLTRFIFTLPQPRTAGPSLEDTPRAAVAG
jgi:two-component system sensor histidine kinase VicK